MTEIDIELIEAATYEREAAEYVAKALATPSSGARASWFSCARTCAQMAEESLNRALKLEQRAKYPRAFAY